ncbi:CzcE family metal-binding protein [Massilia sp. DD77]|uniref:CzcE family metal-binding protein n=1 Tax=Massilia sp. DD77 TaxID=3109349 RepID=UPI003000A98F
MFNMKNTIPMLALALAAASTAQARPLPPGIYGAPASAGAAERVIDVTPQTRYLNVHNGETVTIRVGGASFTWHVDTFPHIGAFPLSLIAPAGIDAGGATVYVSANPTYQNA